MMSAMSNTEKSPPGDQSLSWRDGRLVVPDRPTIPFIEGDGIGPDIWRATQAVVDASVEHAYQDARQIVWMEIYAGEQANAKTGEWIPEETFEALREFKVGIKGPLTTPVGGGIRSLNVTLRQVLDLYSCIRPVRWIEGVPSPVKEPEKLDVIIFRENTEDVYAGIEWASGTPEAEKVRKFLVDELDANIRDESGIGIKPISPFGTKRHVAAAIRYALDRNRRSATLVHKGNIMKFTEGAFRNWGYELAVELYGATEIGDGPWCEFTNPVTGNTITVKDVIADNFLQQIVTRPTEYEVVATLNLNGDYISDALAAQVGGIGIAPGANIADTIGVFEATHGTAPKYAGMDKVNPGSIILSAEMMLRYIGLHEAADYIMNGVARTIANKELTFDLARLREAMHQPIRKARPQDVDGVVSELEQLIPGATLVGTKGFGDAVMRHMDD